MNDLLSLSHAVWDCKYHIVWIPKHRRKVLYGELQKHPGEMFRELAGQKESRVMEGHSMPDPVHMFISIPPKYAVAQVIGSMKGRVRFILPGCTVEGRKTLSENTFGQGGYYVSTAGKDEEAVREYIELSVPGIGYLVEKSAIFACKNGYKPFWIEPLS